MLVLLMLMFLGASFASFLGFLIAQFFLGVPLLNEPDLLADLSDPELIPALRIMQIMQALGLLIVPAFVYLALSRSGGQLRMVFGSPSRQAVMLSVVIFMVALPFINYVADWNAHLSLPQSLAEWATEKEKRAELLTVQFLHMPDVGLLVLNIFMMALLPALGEELLFRGVVQRALTGSNLNAHLAVWLSAILFSAIHMQFYGFIPRMLMGAALGYLFLWSGNLWYPIIAHFTNNAMAVILAYMSQHGQLRTNMDAVGIQDSTVAAFSVAFCLMVLFLFRAIHPAPSAIASVE
jgi:membrane protease YdiL (CAAX protease family)